MSPNTSTDVNVQDRRVHDDNFVLNELKKLLRDGLATIRPTSQRVQEASEQTFIASNDQTLSTDGSLSFQIENPSGSSHELGFYYGEVTHQDDFRVTLHTSVSGVPTSDTVNVSNNHIGSTVTSVANVQEASSFTSEDTHFSQVYTGSNTEQVFNGYRITLPAGESIILEIANLGGSNEVGSRLAWAESEVTAE